MGRVGRCLIGVSLAFGALACRAWTNVDNVSGCSASDECYRRFGVGSVCNEVSGRCVNRCRTTFPPDLLSSPDKHRGRIPIAMLFDGANVTQRGREGAVQEVIDQADTRKSDRFALIACSYENNRAFGAASQTTRQLQDLTKQLADYGVRIVIGPTGSTASSTVLGTQGAEQLTLISPSATREALNLRSRFWRTVPPDNMQTKVIRGIVEQHDPLVLYKSTDHYAADIADSLMASSKETIKDLEEQVRGESKLLFIAPSQREVRTFLDAAFASSTVTHVYLTDSGANTAVFSAVLGDGERSAAFLKKVRIIAPRIGETHVGEYSRQLIKVDGRYHWDIYNAFARDASWLAFYAAERVYSESTEPTQADVDCALSELTHCDREREPLVTIDHWETVTDSGHRGCLRGYSGVLFFGPPQAECGAAGSSVSEQSLGGPDGGLDVGEDAGAEPEALLEATRPAHYPVEREFGLLCPQLQDGDPAVKLVECAE